MVLPLLGERAGVRASFLFWLCRVPVHGEGSISSSFLCSLCSFAAILSVAPLRLRVFALILSPCHFLPRQLPGVLVEVNVMLPPFQFASLKIHIIRTHRFLGRSKRLIVVAVGRHPIP